MEKSETLEDAVRIANMIRCVEKTLESGDIEILSSLKELGNNSRSSTPSSPLLASPRGGESDSDAVARDAKLSTSSPRNHPDGIKRRRDGARRRSISFTEGTDALTVLAMSPPPPPLSPVSLSPRGDVSPRSDLPKGEAPISSPSSAAQNRTLRESALKAELPIPMVPYQSVYDEKEKLQTLKDIVVFGFQEVEQHLEVSTYPSVMHNIT